MIIVTGGAGFIGSNIVKELNDNGEDRILIVDRLGISDKWKNLVDLAYLDYVHKDDFMTLAQQGLFKQGVSALFHLGACSSTTERDADYLAANNYRYTKRLAEIFVPMENVRFIYASSAATYGDGSLGYSDEHESLRALKPLNMYGYSKQMFDLWAMRTGLLNKVVGLKYFNVFGPNEYHKADMRSVVIRAYFQAKQTGKVRLFKSYRSEYKDGEQCRDFIYVKDAAEISLHFYKHPDQNGIFNVGTGNPRTFNDLASAVFSALKMEENIQYIDMPDSLEQRYQYYTAADTKKLKASGYQAEFTSLESAVKDYILTYLENDPRGESEGE